MNTSSKKGSALIIAIMICGVIMIIALYLFEKIIPTSSATKGNENSNAAYYQALSAVEETQTNISPSNPGVDYSSSTPDTEPKYWKTNTVAQGTKIPLSGQGNSDYDKNYNRIALGQPAQLVLKGSLPDVNSVIVTFKTFSGTILNPSLDTSSVIGWTLSAESNTLFSNTGGFITGDNITNSTSININGLTGVDGTGTTDTLGHFYGTNCNGSTQICTLKFMVITPISSNQNEPLPYIEYMIDFGGIAIPQQYTTITAEGYAPGFKQTIIKKLQQTTTNEALDFTVFQ